MARHHMGAAAVALAMVVSAVGPAAATEPPVDPAMQMVGAGDCDRACLDGLMDEVLQAMATHAPERLPLRAGVHYTENGQSLRLGDGLWGTAEGVGERHFYVADPKSGGVVFIGMLCESGRQVESFIRLRVKGRRITEIEALVTRPAGMGPPAAPAGPGFVVRPVFTEPLAPAERRPREELVAVANSYFQGLEQATDKVTPFEPDCGRTEDGMLTSNDSSAPKGSMQSLSCGAQFATGFSRFITEVRGRRFPLVDEERGLVLALVSFDHAGKIKTVKMTDGSTMTVPPPFDAPFSFLMAELFKIRNGRIARVEAVIYTTPYGMPSGW